MHKHDDRLSVIDLFARCCGFIAVVCLFVVLSYQVLTAIARVML